MTYGDSLSTNSGELQFHQTVDFAENITIAENSVAELTLNRSGTQDIRIHVEGLGISFPKQIVLN